MTSFIDTHCHLDMLSLSLEEVFEKAQAVHVQKMITIATDDQSIQYVAQTVQEIQGNLYGTLGVHPHEAKTYTPQTAQTIRDLIHIQNIVAVGEIGLDYHYLYSPKEVQQKVFQQQLILAEELQYPAVLHTREAVDDTLSILKEVPLSHRGVAHSFTSGLDMARELIDLDWYIGINGIVTFKSAEEVREVVRFVPLERLLLETDSPFLTPVPFRGKPNDPSKIPIIAEFIAKEKQVSLDQLMEQTNQNAQDLFQFPA